MYEYSVVKVDLPRSNDFCGFVGVGAIGKCWLSWVVRRSLVIRLTWLPSGGFFLKHFPFRVVAIGYEVHLSSFHSVSFRFSCLNSTQQVLSNRAKVAASGRNPRMFAGSQLGALYE